MHPCKALLKVRDEVQGARSSQNGLDSLLVTKSAALSPLDLVGFAAYNRRGQILIGKLLYYTGACKENY